jgi:hypothetical protein
MTNQWYYGRGADVSGPVSSQELFDLAVCGKVIPTDTIWRDDNETGVPAAKVKNLFPITHAGSTALPAAMAAPEVPKSSPEIAYQAPSTKENVDLPAPPPQPAINTPAIVQAPAARQARASAGTGAVIVSQDGKIVKFRGKCTTCGREDTSWKSIAIPRGTTRASFFCSKCRKRRDIEIHGHH